MASKVIAVIVFCIGCAAAQDRAAIDGALAGCGPANAKFKIRADKSNHLTPGPEPGKARLYFVGDSTFGVDGSWIGASRGDSYFSVSLDPGVHHLCARFSHWQPYFWLFPLKITAYSVHRLDAAAGGIYYVGLRGSPYSNVGYFAGFPFYVTVTPPQESMVRAARIELIQYDADEGARIVASSRFSTSRQKK